VQALGQSIFLPMIMIGGVGVPLRVLPAWVQTLAGFLPGRYAVEVIQTCFNGPRGLSGSGFDLIALAAIGLAACVAGAKLFRWDANQHVSRLAKGWVALALLSWLAVGAAAQFTGRLKPVPAFVVAPGAFGAEAYESVTAAQINGITYDNLPPDDGTITPLAPAGTRPKDVDDRDRLDAIAQKLATWPPAHEGMVGQRVRNLLSAAAIADVTEDPLEGPIARVVFQRMQADYPREQLIKVLASIILDPQGGTVMHSAPELELRGNVAAEIVRDRDAIYARKFLGRLLGKISRPGMTAKMQGFALPRRSAAPHSFVQEAKNPGRRFGVPTLYPGVVRSIGASTTWNLQRMRESVSVRSVNPFAHGV
jgi:ABC-2 type transport system permease protein